MIREMWETLTAGWWLLVSSLTERLSAVAKRISDATERRAALLIARWR